MPSKSFVVSGLIALAITFACSHTREPGVEAAVSASSIDEAGTSESSPATSSEGTSGASADERLFVPEGLPNTEVGGGDEGLNLVAFTLQQGANGPELYAAVRNDGETPLCNAGLVVNFFDGAGLQIATSGVALRTGRLYRLNDDSGTVTACVAPGQVAMAAATDLPDAVVIDDVAYLEHTFPAFGLDVTFLDASAVSSVETVSRGAGSVYRGVLSNLLDAPVHDPSIHIFPLNVVGRPLGVATSSEVIDIPAGGTWAFETTVVEEPGVSPMVFATVKL
jgi:hypothetical protein